MKLIKKYRICKNTIEWPPPMFTIWGIIFYFEHEVLQELLKILKFTHFKIRKKLVFMVFNAVDTYWWLVIDPINKWQIWNLICAAGQSIVRTLPLGGAPIPLASSVARFGLFIAQFTLVLITIYIIHLASLLASRT